MEQIIEDAWLLPMGYANAVLLRHQGELTLVDTGFADKEQIFFDSIKKLGFKESDLKHIVLTHAHPDHLGVPRRSFRAQRRRSGFISSTPRLQEAVVPFAS